MKITLFIVAALLALAGVLMYASAQSSIHEIEAFLLLTISSILGVGGSVLGAIAKNTAAVRGGKVVEQEADPGSW